ncbi:unnamed protein product [Larinioides sclopetarius]|uniref:CRAL-TRIO domain-containing protein n=1 Tax=Larinioides sclopetarius TaxID=280406 RepID=A0AAV1ZQC5_9ARAC
MTKEGMDTLLFKMDHIPDRFWNKASIELNETDENKVKGLGKLKELTEIYPTGITFPEDILLQFLRHSKFDVIKASTRLKRFVCFWRKHPELFASIPENYISSKASTKFGTILPFRCPDGCTILLTKPGLWDPSEMEFEDFKKLAFMLFIQPLCELMTQINGYKIIHDFGGTSVKHFKYCTPENLRLQYEAAMQCIPARYKEFHVVNGYGVFTAIWTLLKPLLSSKLRSRVFFFIRNRRAF